MARCLSEAYGIPPIRQKKGEWMGHGAFEVDRTRPEGFIRCESASPVGDYSLFPVPIHCSLFSRRNVRDWEIPVRQENLEPPLLFPLVRLLVRP